jgi:UDP-glucose 4-epimerase
MVKERHVILGGSGFIGRHVGLMLARAGHQVVLTARRRPNFEFPKDVKDLVTWSILELGSADWDAIVDGASVVHHYAWASIPASANSNPAGDLITNVSSTLGLLEALRRRGGGRIVFASSGGTVYGEVKQTPVSEDHPIAPITAYGASKATAEIYFNLYRSMHGMDCRIARIANPFGAGQDFVRGLGAVTTFLHNALSGEPLQIWGTGEVVRDYIHISDVAACLVALAQPPKLGDNFIFNVGSGNGTSLNDIVYELEKHLNRRLEVKRTKARAFDVPVSVLSIDRVAKSFGWRPTLSLSDGIALTIADMAAKSDFSTLTGLRDQNRPKLGLA